MPWLSGLPGMCLRAGTRPGWHRAAQPKYGDERCSLRDVGQGGTSPGSAGAPCGPGQPQPLAQPCLSPPVARPSWVSPSPHPAPRAGSDVPSFDEGKGKKRRFGEENPSGGSVGTEADAASFPMSLAGGKTCRYRSVPGPGLKITTFLPERDRRAGGGSSGSQHPPPAIPSCIPFPSAAPRAGRLREQQRQ